MSWVKVKLEEFTWKHSCVEQTRLRAHHYVNRGRLIRCVRVATAHYCCESSSSSLHLEKCNCSCRKRGTTKAFLHLIMELKGKVWMNLWWRNLIESHLVCKNCNIAYIHKFVWANSLNLIRIRQATMNRFKSLYSYTLSSVQWQTRAKLGLFMSSNVINAFI